MGSKVKNNFGWTNEEEIYLLTSVGNQKTGFSQRDYTPTEAGEKISSAIQNGATQKEIAKFLSVDSSIVGRLNRVYSDLDSNFHHLVSFTPVPDGQISFDSAQEIARFERNDQSFLVKALLEYKFRREQIQAVFQQLERSDKDLDEIIETVSKRTGGKRKLLIIGLVPENLTEKIQKIKLNDLNVIAENIKKDTALQEILQKEQIELQRFQIGKSTFSLLFLRSSLPRKIIEELSKVIVERLHLEFK